MRIKRGGMMVMEDMVQLTYNPEELDGIVLDIRYDAIFKAVFANEKDPQSLAALSSMLSSVIGRDLAAESVTRNEPVTDFIDEKRIRYDVNCVFTDKTRCNVEMTLHPLACEAYRIEYYGARFHTSQSSKGKRYSELVPTYQVSIINKPIFADDDFYHSFEMYDAKRDVSLGGRMHIYTVELGKVETIARSKPVSEMTPLERWSVYFLYNADTSEFGKKLIGEITRAEEGVKMATQVKYGFSVDEERLLRLISEQKYEMDIYTGMAEAEERGIQIGEERGIQIGGERERQKADAEIAAERQKTEQERQKAESDRAAAIAVLKSQGVSDEVIAQAYGER
jgi:predicted transposase/invertase (TIGR01784 family)